MEGQNMKLITIKEHGKRIRRNVTIDCPVKPGDLIRATLIEGGNAFIKVPADGWLLVQEVSVPEGKVATGNFTPDGTTGFGQVTWPKFLRSMIVRGEHGGNPSPLGALTWLASDLVPADSDDVRKVKEAVLHDNRRVQTTKYGGEFLAVTFAEPDNDWTPWSVALYRYCVPGRIDRYMFDYAHGRSGVGPRIRYFTDSGMTLVKSLAQVQIDLDRPQVIKMLVEACSKWKLRGWARDLTERLIADIAPKSKCLRALRRAMQAAKEEALKLQEKRTA
jgi:hypothetical protein